MSFKQIAIVFIASALVAFVMGCAGGGKLLVEETYSQLEPVKQLELPEQIEDNLVITISNVADETSSYKNRLALYINDRLIEPNWLVSNVEDTYTYKVKLKPGYYKVKAYYYAYVGWREEKFQIDAQELVRVTPTTRTILTCRIEKKPNGVPVNDKMYFKVKSESLLPSAKSTSAVTLEKTKPKVTKVIIPASPKPKVKKIIRAKKRP